MKHAGPLQRTCSPVSFFDATSFAESFRLLSFLSLLSFLPRVSFREDSFSPFFRRLCLLCLPRSLSLCRFFDLQWR